MPDPVFSQSAALRDLIRQQQELLGLVFEDPGLAQLRQRHPAHPAVEQMDQLTSLLERGLLWPHDFELMHAFAQVGLDLLSWIPQPPFRDVWETVGRDASTLSSLKEPSQYEDVMAELFVWGWLTDHGIPVRRLYVPNRPDVLVDDRWPIEVKRLHVGAGEDRIGEILKKANKQIKQIQPEGGGSVYISVERNPRRQALDDRVPNDVLSVAEAVRSALGRGVIRGVSQVIVGWDDVMILGEPPGRVKYAFRRRSTLVAHPDPRQRPLFSKEQLEFGRTFVAGVQYQPVGVPGAPRSTEPIETHEVVVSSLFQDENHHPLGVRASHAIEAIAEPDDIARMQYNEVEIAFATRKVAQQTPAFVLLAIAMRRAGEKFQLVGGYRLYRCPASVDIGTDARAAFGVLLERYGLEVSVGGQRGFFIGLAVALPGASLQFAKGSGDFAVHTLRRRRADGCAEYGAAYAVDRGKYKSAVRKKSS